MNDNAHMYYTFSAVRADNRYDMVVETELDIDTVIAIRQGLGKYPAVVQGSINKCKNAVDFPLSIGPEYVVSSNLARIVRQYQGEQIVGSIVKFKDRSLNMHVGYEVIDTMLVVDCANKQHSVVDKPLSQTSFENIVYKEFVIDPAAIPPHVHFFRPLGCCHLVMSQQLFDAIRSAGLSGLIEYPASCR